MNLVRRANQVQVFRGERFRKRGACPLGTGVQSHTTRSEALSPLAAGLRPSRASIGRVKARKLLLVLAGAVVFGLLAAWAKDPASNGISDMARFRSALGNLSAPWVLLAFAAGAAARRVPSGAALGAAATAIALAAFYVFNTLVVDLGGHGLVGDLRLEFVGNRYYFAGGLITGPLFGALGTWWREHRSLRVSVLAGALMTGEPLALALLGGIGLPSGIPLLAGWGFPSGDDVIGLGVYTSEFAAGVVCLAATVARKRLPDGPDAG